MVVSASYGVMGRWREEYDDTDAQRAHELMRAWGVEHLSGRTYGTLSEGERKRALIARALMSKPKLCIFDEPSLGLAPKIVAEVEQTLARIKAMGVTDKEDK